MMSDTVKTPIAELTREELIALVNELTNRVRELEEKLRLKRTPTTSKNSSQPPSRDFKSDKKKRKRNRKKGAKNGHEKQERALVENPDKVFYALVDNCQSCHVNLLDQVPVQIIRRQISELPEIKPVVIETQQYEVLCPCCGEVQRGKLPEGLEAWRYFGPRLEATVTMLHHEHHVGFERLVGLCSEIFNLPLSEGGAVSIVKRAGKAVLDEAEKIGEKVRHGKVVGSDETHARVHGINWWQWVFVSENCEYHLMMPSRGYDVIETFMRDCEAEVWVCDCWKPQLNAPAKMCQICLAHQIRNLQSLIEKRPHLAWAKEMQALFRKAIHLGNRRAQMTARGYQRQVTIIEKKLDQLLKRRFSGLGTNLLDRYRKRRDSLLIFLDRTDVPADNNACERALRPSVVHRKVMGSFRSDWGAQTYAPLATVLNTAKRNGENAFQKLVQLMGTPVLPFLLQPDFA
ncbi:MAG: IS66 family transposase [Chloroflexi bacterium]|nr:IS66 family transposase [Chloroflexota bacterium]